MLKLYYTTTKGEEVEQPNYYNSLGGYKAATPVKNDEFDNIFGEISSYTIAKNDQNQYIALILKNEGGNKANINLWFEHLEDCYSKLYIAAVDLIADANGKFYMEDVPTLHSAPLYATFHESETEETAVSLGDLLAGEMLGLWVKREILIDKAKEDSEQITEQDPNDENRVRQKTLTTSDTIEMKFSYD